MTFNKRFVRFFVLLIPLLLIVGSCKKKKAFKAEDGQSSVDARMLQGHNDEVISDINSVIMNQALIRGRNSELTGVMGKELCGVDIDTVDVYRGIVRLNYNGKECNGFKKTGTITITFTDYPTHKWKHQGAVVKIDFLTYTVFQVSSQKSVQLDGTEYLTNISGKTWYDLYYSFETSVVQTLTGNNIKVTFNGSKVAVYNFNRQMTFTYHNSVMTCKVEGLETQNGESSVENWGQTRDGDFFTSQVSTPVIWNSTCGPNSPLEGEVVIKVDNKDFKLNCRFGVDGEGNDLAGSGSCPFGFKLTWSYKRKTSSRVFQYN